MAKEVAKAKTTAVGSYDYGEYAGEGFEDVKSTDLSIPFLSVMQASSKLVKAEDNNIKAGDIVNSVTGEVMKQPIVVHPVHKDHLWAEWTPRSKGGGRGDSHEDDDPMVQKIIADNGGNRIPPEDADGKRNPFKTPEGMDLIETFYYYVMIMDADGKEHEGFAVLPFSSTKIKVQKDWTSSMYMIKGRPPMVAHRAVISTVKENAKGEDYFNLLIRPFGDTWKEGLIQPDEAGNVLMQEGRDFRAMIRSGSARAATETEDGGAGDAPRTKKNADGDDIPF